jgi:hypothetical protein
MDLAALRQVCDSIPNWWMITTGDLERLAKAQLGLRANRWLRSGAERAIVAKNKYGAVAATLDKELTVLAKDSQRIGALGHIDSALKAVAWYHVRFENIHPLHDGNGRVGRVIMTGQLYQACQLPPALFEQHLTAHQMDYRLAFDAASSEETFRQLLLLLSRIVQIQVTSTALPPDISFEPLHRSLGNPAAPQARGQPFRKFR